ncbi:hypothetical protein ACPF04_01085 [Campylobacter sp. MOP51]|uniref:hypothetical protein n=1 Tax=Campylobacter canis TaxID=3378588 RepID=UPI003C37F8E4
MRKILILPVVLTLFLGCAGSQGTKQNDQSRILSNMIKCKMLGGETFVFDIASYGPLADGMMAASVRTTHNDGGFFSSFNKYLASGTKNFVFSSVSSMKLEAVVASSFLQLKGRNLIGVKVCLAGLEKSDELSGLAKELGIELLFIK